MIRVVFTKQWEDMGRIFKRNRVIGISDSAWLESEKTNSDFVKYGMSNISKAHIAPFASDIEMFKLDQKYNKQA